MSQLTLYTNAVDFLAQTQALFEQDEVSNGLMLGVCLRMKEHPERVPQGLFLATVHEQEKLIASAMMTPPHNLVVQSNSDEPAAAFTLIAQRLREWAFQPPGVNGRKEASGSFAEIWQGLSGQRYHAAVQMRVFKLSQVLHGLATPGNMRLATMNDLMRVMQWQEEFEHEALPHAAKHTDPSVVEWTIREGNRFLWEIEGKPVSMAGKTRPTARGCTVGPVYTPPQFRGNGYATGLVAHLSQQLLDSGFQFTTLFTDLANPTSNSIYQKIGYRPVCDFTENIFERAA